MNAEHILTWIDGRWHRGNVPILGAADHATWLGSLVFDGARAFEGVTPDLDLHCARTNRSARRMGLEPHLTDGELTEVALEGVAAFPAGSELYIRPMIWARGGCQMMIVPDAETTAVAVCIEEKPMPPGPVGLSLTRTRFRRPTIECMPTDVKAGCLYPNNARMLREARSRGFDNAVVLDALGNVAETATSNIFLVRDGEVFTPIPTGCFLNGITRQRVIGLLRDDGVAVHEASLTPADLDAAEEIFTTGNATKVMPITRFEDRNLPFGPIARRARELYWDFAHSRLKVPA
ncbi:branched-chain amino acid aminotransferase [Paralimibaculum aggregatum]|uniref:Probable branched-chain-amino-acid aminotransferase n=1 Tax=Paralimibaculum aggregatum TaxID=3036245 RepID=A0ABQ6LI06_9RHOB|nr:branched-chain amino acid aminotransferase [Limibaculum sp. NKW23]GMG82923.1 branched-chain amino acid aminotransferase [Limibaculum sp. NKW23]